MNHLYFITVGLLFLGLLFYPSERTEPYIIQLRKKWRDKTEYDAIKDVNDCCTTIFCLRPEISWLCKFDEEIHLEYVNDVRNNECYDLYRPDDYQYFKYFNSNLKADNMCEVIQHFQTPLTRCLYSKEFLCDSRTGFFRRDYEDKFIHFARIAYENRGTIYKICKIFFGDKT